MNFLTLENKNLTFRNFTYEFFSELGLTQKNFWRQIWQDFNIKIEKFCIFFGQMWTICAYYFKKF